MRERIDGIKFKYISSNIVENILNDQVCFIMIISIGSSTYQTSNIGCNCSYNKTVIM